MATMNRQPFSVGQPDIKYNFFNHNNWKGVCDNKNFLAVDQETFEDAKNVYIDNQGLLKSRPSIKLSKEVLFDNILNFWTFPNTVVYLIKSEKYVLNFVYNNEEYPIEVNTDKLKLILADEKIFVFFEDALYYFDISDSFEGVSRWLRGDNLIYSPKTKIFVDGVEREGEPANELSTSEIYSYLFSTYENAIFTEFIGKTVTLKIDGNSYTVDFVEDNELVFVKKSSKLNRFNFSYDVVDHVGEPYPLISVSEKGSFILYTLTNSNNTYDVSIYYTSDGVTFDKVPDISGVISIPKISRDGTYASVLRDDGIYFYSLIKTEYVNDTTTTYKYPQWTNICLSDKFIYDWSRLLDRKFFTAFCNGDFVSYDNFSVVIPCGLLNDDIEGIDTYCSVCIICTKGEYYILPVNTPTFVRDEISINLKSSYNVTKYELSSDEYNKDLFISLPIKGNEYKDFKIGICSIRITGEATIIPVQDGNDVDVSVNIRISCKDDNNVEFYNNSIAYNFLIHCNSSNNYEGTYKIVDINAPVYLIANFVCNSNTNEFSFNVNENNLAMYNYFSDGVCKQVDGYSTPNVQMDVSNDIYNILVDINVIGIDDAPVSRELIILYRNIGNNYSTHLLNYDDTYNRNKRKPIRNGLLCSSNYIKHCVMDTNSYITIYEYYFSLHQYESEINKIGTYNDKYKDDTFVISKNSGYILSDRVLITPDFDVIPLLFEATPVDFYYYGNAKNSMYLATYDNLYISHGAFDAEIQVENKGKLNNILFDANTELSDFYFSKGKTLYISSYPSEEQFKWYFPKNKTETFDDIINNLHPISDTEVAIFFDDSIYYVSKKDDAYFYNKSKIGVGCNKGSDVITTFDGTKVIFSSQRGLVAMSYQDFISSSEQSLTYLSDTIFKKYDDFNKGAIKLYQHQFYIICYRIDSKLSFVFDVRNSSWWPIECYDFVNKLLTIDNKISLLSNNKIHYLDTSNIDYKDDNNFIEWFIVSQKLHLDAINYNKHIINIILATVNENEDDNACNIKLTVKNYRKRTDQGKEEIVEYDVDMIRTFVKRLNYSKVTEFQYSLANDKDKAIQYPISLSNISIKYNVTGVVR